VGFQAIVGLVAALAGGIASIAGFGIGSLLTPLLASHYDMKAAVGAVSIPHVIATAIRFWKLRRDVDRKVLLGFGVMNACGALIGAFAHSRVGGSALTAVLGVLLVFRRGYWTPWVYRQGSIWKDYGVDCLRRS